MINYRQDFPAQKWSYGFRLNDGGASTAYRFNEISRRSRDDMGFEIWVETSRWLGLRIRAGIDDLFAPDFSRTRVIYGQDPNNPAAAPDRNTGVLRQIEQTHSSNGVRPYVKISGNF
jgi:hypothetical protein